MNVDQVAHAMHNGLTFAISALIGFAVARWTWRRAVMQRRPRAHQLWCAGCIGLSLATLLLHTPAELFWWLALVAYISGLTAMVMSADKRYTK